MAVEIRPDNYDAYTIIQLLANKLGDTCQRDYIEQSVSLKGEGEEGRYSGFQFKGGLEMLLLEDYMKAEIKLIFPKVGNCPLILCFCVEGSLQHRLEERERMFKLVAGQASISANSAHHGEEIHLGSFAKNFMVLLFIDREKFVSRKDARTAAIARQLFEVLQDEKCFAPFYYKTNYNLAGNEILKEIIHDKNKGLIRSTLLEGLALQLVSHQIKQFQSDLDGSRKEVMLRAEELDIIFKAKGLLLEQMNDPPTIEELAHQLGINQTKLKDNFKKVFGTPIKTWFTDQRFEKARLFLINDHLTIEEVARKVGYANFSYFSSQFKKRYGLLPKEYLRHLHEDLGVQEGYLS